MGRRRSTRHKFEDLRGAELDHRRCSAGDPTEFVSVDEERFSDVFLNNVIIDRLNPFIITEHLNSISLLKERREREGKIFPCRSNHHIARLLFTRAPSLRYWVSKCKHKHLFSVCSTHRHTNCCIRWAKAMFEERNRTRSASDAPL